MRGLQVQIKALEAKVGILVGPRETALEGSDGGGKRRDEIENLESGSQNVQSGDKASLGDYQAGTERVAEFMAKAARE